MKSFTLIIPTHNRQDYLIRSYSYYSKFNFKVIYCDSTITPYNLVSSNNIFYYHLPNFSFSEKILYVLEKIDTDYVALCADDDFILSDTISLGYEIISCNKKITTIIGNIVQFHEKFDNTFFTNKIYASTNFNYPPKKNVDFFLSNYRQILWGMYKKEILNLSFLIIKELELNNDNFIELIISVVSAYNGEIKFLNNIWSARELSFKQHWATKHQSLFYYRTNKSIQVDLRKFELIIDKYTEIGIGKIAFRSYLKTTILAKTMFLIKGIIKNYFKLSNLKLLQNSPSRYITINYTNNQSLINILKLLQKINSV